MMPWGIILFIVITTIFLILYLKKGATEALIITSILTTIAVLLIPSNTVLMSFYLRIAGRWRLIVIDLTVVKLIIIIGLLFVFLFREDIKKRFKVVVE